jgi:hypothetical protein
LQPRGLASKGHSWSKGRESGHVMARGGMALWRIGVVEDSMYTACGNGGKRCWELYEWEGLAVKGNESVGGSGGE